VSQEIHQAQESQRHRKGDDQGKEIVQGIPPIWISH
jgi:hypothetical protein